MAKRSNDTGLRNMMRNLQGVKIEAGIFKESKARRSANGSRADNLAYRLKIHDQGLGNNPERQVLAPALDATIKDAESVIVAHMRRLDGSARLQAKSLGQRFANNIQIQFIKASPAKKESTIRAAQRRYGGGRRSSTLIQAGEMRQAVTFKIK